jgi:peptide/nickel transport system permease protein
MVPYVLRRLPSAVLVLFLASIVIFFILRLIPGDPAAALAGPDAGAATVSAIRHKLGLDLALTNQYVVWLKGILTGDPGNSYILHAPIAQLIGESLGNTVELAVGALVLALVGGSLIGYFAGVARAHWVQALLGALTSLGIAIPTYVTAVMLILVFAVVNRALPPGGIGPGLSDFALGWQYLILPAFALSLPTGATIARFLSASLRQTLDFDFIQTGVAKGLSRRRILIAHALPNALPPVITILGLQIGQLLGGAIIVETIFAWPGIGQLLLQAVTSRDYLLTQDLLLIAVAVFVIVQLITDVVDAAMDPRVRSEKL